MPAKIDLSGERIAAIMAAIRRRIEERLEEMEMRELKEDRDGNDA